MEDKIITFFYVLLVVSYLSGCAYNGDVFLYSPLGDSNAVEKVVSTDAEADVSVIP